MNRLDYRTLDQHELHRLVDRDGYAIVENVLNDGMLEWIRREAAPYLEITDEANTSGFLGNHTKRFGRLVYRMPSTHPIILHPMTRLLCDHTIGKYGPTYRLSWTGIMHVMEGQQAQALHWDETPFAPPSPSMVLATMWAVNDFVRDNGATVLVPGSHKWDPTRVPTREELVCAEMPAGSVLFYSGSCLHGAGRCTSGFRTGLSLQYKVGWVRQDENQYLATPLEYARTLPEEMQRLIGYDLAKRHFGSVGNMHPLDFLNEEVLVGTLEPDGYSFDDCVELDATEAEPRSQARINVTLDD